MFRTGMSNLYVFIIYTQLKLSSVIYILAILDLVPFAIFPVYENFSLPHLFVVLDSLFFSVILFCCQYMLTTFFQTSGVFRFLTKGFFIEKVTVMLCFIV